MPRVEVGKETTLESKAMSYDEHELLMISSLQHYMYCPRQFALIHLEGYWKDNFFTALGKQLHERVDLPGNRRDKNRRVEYALPLSSKKHGIYGVADAVEFSAKSVAPVEYKKGAAQALQSDSVQLCAQVFCLEEMLGLHIPKAWLFYFETRSRIEINIDENLRNSCEKTIRKCRELIFHGKTPLCEYSTACRTCSLLEYCMPPKKNTLLCR